MERDGPDVDQTEAGSIGAGGRAEEVGNLRRFEIVRRLGEGGMGVVYEAIDRERGARIALKTLRQTTSETLLRLKNEFRNLQGIEHPNLVSLGELIEEEGKWLLTMELVDGVDLMTYIRRDVERVAQGRENDDTERVAPGDILTDHRQAEMFDESRLRAAIGQLACGLSFLHSAGKIHRDLKPANVRVTPAGRVVILDFGLVTDVAPEAQSNEGNVVGTVAYMAPEQAASAPATPATDWYSVGVLLYEGLTGRLPHTGRTAVEVLLKKQQHEPPPPRARAQVPADLDRLCCDLLQFDPNSRPPGASVLERLGLDRPERSPGPQSSIVSSVSRSATFVGRTLELETLRRAFDETVQGRAATVLVIGASGVGKSALMGQFTGALSKSVPNLVVLAGRCYENESVPYKALDGVVDALSQFLRRLPTDEAGTLVPRNASTLPRAFPVLGRVDAIANAPQRQRVHDPHDLRELTSAALRELFQRLAERRPVIVTIDDLQWGDADSFLLLNDILRPPDSPAILVMMSTRTSIDEDGSGSGRRLPADLQRIHLGALEPAAAEELARTLLERGELGDVANASGIATEAAGHPMFIDELCRRAVQPAQVRSAPLRLDDALWERASALPPVVRRVLELIALAAAPLPQSVFQAAVQLDASDFRRSLSTLRLSAFVRSRGIRDDDLVEPYHDRVREAVAAHLSAKEQRSHHLLLAQALERAGLGTSRPELLLRHLEAGGDLERAARAAVDSARRAEESLAFDRAVDLYRTALRLSNLNADERQALQASLALALSRAGHAVLAAEQYLVASAGVDPTTRREQYTQAAEQFLIAGHVERGLAVIDELLGEVDERLPGTSRRALMSLLWQRARIRLRGFKWKQRHEREIAPSDLARLNVYQAIGEGLAAVDPIRGAAAQSRALVIALRLGEPKRVARALAMEAILLGMKGQGGQARAERVMARAKPIAARVSDPILSAIVLGADGYLRFAVGDFAAAAPIADAVDLRFRTSNVTSVFWQNNARLIGLIARRYRGEYTEQFKRFRELARDAERRGDLYMATSLRRVCSFLWLAMDRAAEASLDLDQSAWAAPAEGFHLQQWYELWARTECALYQGNALTAYDRLDPQFVALSRSLLLMVELVRVFAYWLRGRLALACAERAPEQRRFVRVARQCSRRLRKIKPEYAQIGAAGIEAAIARQAGDDRLAVRLLGEVSGRAEAAGIPLAAAAARHRLGEVVGGADGQQMVEEADRWMRNEGIRNADRMTDVIAPGFHVAKRLPPHVASDR